MNEAAWCSTAEGAWMAMVVVVVVVGGAANVAVILQWLLATPAVDSLATALPIIDLLVCVVATPLRYTQATTMSVALHHHLWHNDTLSEVETLTNISSTGDQNACDGVCVVGRVTVVVLCLASLHMVVIIAGHRAALLFRCASPPPAHKVVSLVVAGVTLLFSTTITCCLHATGRLLLNLPLLGQGQLVQQGASSAPVMVSFLCYLVTLCCFTTLCYLTIMATLIHQQSKKSLTTTPLPNSNVTIPVVLTKEDQCRTVEEGQCRTGKARQGQAVRACVTIGAVLVTVCVCWTLPVTLALYTILVHPALLPTLPYSDALILLSGMVHPFVYGEGWAALLTSGATLSSTLVATAKRWTPTRTHTATGKSREAEDNNRSNSRAITDNISNSKVTTDNISRASNDNRLYSKAADER